jgi:RNA recognition motif-containing protein
LVSGLPEDADEVELLHLFEDCGPISSIRVLREEPDETNNMQRRSRGYAIVSYYTTVAAELALQEPPDPPKPPQEGEPAPPPPAGGKNGLILTGDRVSNRSIERVGDKQARLTCTYADQKSVEKAAAARIAAPKPVEEKKDKGKGKGKGNGKGKGKGKGKGSGKPSTPGSPGSGAGSPRGRGNGDYELMFSDERVRWEAERAQWKRERRALLDYFESEREALFSQTESVPAPCNRSIPVDVCIQLPHTLITHTLW